MFGAIIGDMAGFPYEYRHEDLTDRDIPLFRRAASASSSASGEAQAGEDFSDKTVMTAAVEAGLLQFERILPSIFAKKPAEQAAPEAGTTGRKAEENGTSAQSGSNAGGSISVGSTDGQGARIPQNAFEENYRKEVAAALRSFGQRYPLAGYTMDLSIWLFREGAGPVQTGDAGPAARVSPVAWVFQDDLYMMRHMARVQAELTHRSRESVTAAEAAACAVFLAIHGSTKPYISAYLEREFGYKIPDEEEMRQEILRAGDTRMLTAGTAVHPDAEDGTSLPAMTVRAAMTAFLHGRDFEDVLRRAVSLGGNSADIAAIAGSVAEAFFGIPQELRDACISRLPADLRKAAEAFDARNEQKKKARENNPAAKARWENALTRAGARHPAAVQGNEPLEQAIDSMREKRDEQTFIAALEVLRMRMNQKGRVFVPLVSAKRAEPQKASDRTGAQGTQGTSGDAGKGRAQTPGNGMVYSMQIIRTRDGRLWQPAYTSRAQLDRANAAMAKEKAVSNDPAAPDLSTGMVLSYAMDALFKRFLPAGTSMAQETEKPDTEEVPAVKEIIPPEIQGIVLNPYDKSFFLPRKTLEALFLINREASKGRPGTGKAD